MPNHINELTKFQERCHEFFTCFTFAAIGLQNVADKFRADIVKGQNQTLFIGSGHPDEGKTHSRILLKDAVAFSEENGVFSDTLAKSIIVSIYAEWDEIYRQRIAAELAVEAKDVMCDLIGDLRFVRHCIVHNKSLVDKNLTKMKILPWQFCQGEELRISKEMFSTLIDNINTASVSVRAS